MKIKIITILLISLFIIGCWKVQFVNPPEQPTQTENNSINQTNTTEIKQESQIKYNESYPNIFISPTNSILIIDSNKSYIIDSPKENPKIINLLNEFNIKETEFIASTINKEEHNGGIKYIVVKAPPKVIYDNGIDDEARKEYIYRLDRYNLYWNRTNTTYVTVLDDFKYNSFSFFVPYSKGLSEKKEENSITVSYKGRFLYMSDCYGECEKRVPPITTDFLVLANNGKCQTNSFDFVLGTGAEYVVGDELCPELKEELDIIGVKHIVLEGRTIQILLKGDENEIRYE